MIDHLVYATPDLRATMSDIERALGITPVIGGRHVGRGTWNALLSLVAIDRDNPFARTEGPYLELIAPDPDQPDPDDPRPFGIDSITEPTLITWAARVDDMEAALARSTAAGFDPGPAQPMQRETPDGDLLSWSLTMPQPAFGGVVPFLIDWGQSVHPSITSPRGASMHGFLTTEMLSPDAAQALAALDLQDNVLVAAGSPSNLSAQIISRRGSIQL